MRAAVLSGHDLRELIVRDIPDPQPGPGEVAVRVETVGVNQLDLNVIAGVGPGARARLPRVLGIDPAGTITAVGEGVDAGRVGESVVVKPNIPCGNCSACIADHEEDCPRQIVVGVHRDGGAAEIVIVPARSAFDRRGLDAAQASAVVHSAAIVLNAAEAVGLGSSDRVLVMGAGGTLGRAATAIALHRGADVVAASRRPLRRVGDERTVTAPDTVALEAALGRLGTEFDVLLDVTGNAPTLGIGIAALGWGGRAVFCSASVSSDLRIDARDFYLRRKVLRGAASAGYRHVAEALDLAASGVIPDLVGQRHPLADIAQAYTAFPTKKDGKVIIDVQ
ncbi:alcohol dehydrogenase catalytic domain-containing protein [Microbacterium sp. NPDC057659]|uniref:alcohol dehydrogenase catalytic domain-containing protein n=1 Tax=Microbacterium sp. NPDC057659 TaxID=3346198 RepID=UPI00366C9BFF